MSVNVGNEVVTPNATLSVEATQSVSIIDSLDESAFMDDLSVTIIEMAVELTIPNTDQPTQADFSYDASSQPSHTLESVVQSALRTRASLESIETAQDASSTLVCAASNAQGAAHLTSTVSDCDSSDTALSSFADAEKTKIGALPSLTILPKDDLQAHQSLPLDTDHVKPAQPFVAATEVGAAELPVTPSSLNREHSKGAPQLLEASSEKGASIDESELDNNQCRKEPIALSSPSL